VIDWPNHNQAAWSNGKGTVHIFYELGIQVDVNAKFDLQHFSVKL
jgi:hypothetical protein